MDRKAGLFGEVDREFEHFVTVKLPDGRLLQVMRADLAEDGEGMMIDPSTTPRSLGRKPPEKEKEKIFVPQEVLDRLGT